VFLKDCSVINANFHYDLLLVEFGNRSFVLF